MRLHRLFPVVVAASAAVVVACSPTAPLGLPGGLPLGALTPAQRSLVRVTVTVDGDGAERELRFDPDALTISGDFALDNAGDGGARAAVLRVWGRIDADAAETLLGEATGNVDVQPGGRSFVDFSGSTFDTCGASAGACTLRFDENRNAVSNIEDLLLGRDPAPQAPFLLAPDTLQFASGLRIGAVARQVIVIDNLSSNPVRIDTIRVAGGQGIGVSTYSADPDAVPAPRRVLDAAALDTEADADSASDFVVMPGEEAYVAVSFSPANSSLTTASVHVVAVDTVTLVQQAVSTKVIANADGALRPRDPDYREPDAFASLTTRGGTVRAQAFPGDELFSGIEIIGVDDPETDDVREEAQLAYTGARLAVGADLDVPADVAFVVDVPPRARFAAALGGLVDGTDVDVALVDVEDPAAPALVGVSNNVGSSAEALELVNGAQPRRVAVVLGRVERDPPPAVVGGLSAAEAIPFRLTCQLTRGPEFRDADPLTTCVDGEAADEDDRCNRGAARGPLAGGTPVRIHGSGFFVPDNGELGPHVRVTFDGAPAIGVPRVTRAGEDGLQTIDVVLPPGAASAADRPVAVTVQNPTSGAGQDGDGQAVTLAGGFRYDLPSPRLAAITPDAATIDGGSEQVTLTGAFFFDVYGAPEVAFGDAVVTAEFVDSATLRVQPPSRATGVSRVSVRNRIFGGGLGEPSEARPFAYFTPAGPPPTIDAIAAIDDNGDAAPARGSSDGGAVVRIRGRNFSGARVFFGTELATVTTATANELLVTAPRTLARGAVDVLVQNRDGQRVTAAGAFVYALPIPRIDDGGVFPPRAPTAGGTPVIVDGSGFRDGVVVTFEDGATSVPAATPIIVSSTRLIVTTPPFAPSETVRLVVTNADGVAADHGFAFFVPAGPPPTIVALTPGVVDPRGGALVTLTGSNLSERGVDIIVVSTTIRAVPVLPAENGLQRASFFVPPGEAGPALVTVVNADGQIATDTLTYIDEGAPRILVVSPTTLHAEVSGDELLVFGERLSLLGSALTLRATALVTTPETGEGAVFDSVALRVDAVSDTVARLTVVEPLPAGDVVLELAGAGRTVSHRSLVARKPDVRQMQATKALRGIDGGSEVIQVMLLGDHLAGDRLQGPVMGGALEQARIEIEARPAGDPPVSQNIVCRVVTAEETMALCTVDALEREPTTPLTVRLVYSTGETVVDDDVEFIDIRDADDGGSDGAARIDSVSSGVWGSEEPNIIEGVGFTQDTRFEARLASGQESAPLLVQGESPQQRTFRADALPPGPWLICLVEEGQCIEIEVSAPGREIEPNQTLATATGIGPGRPVRGALDFFDTNDSFFFATRNRAEATAVTVAPEGEFCAGVRVELFAVRGREQAELLDEAFVPGCEPVTLPVPANAPEIVLVSLSGFTSTGVSYQLTIEASGAPPPGCGDGRIDPGETCEGRDLSCLACIEQDDANDDFDNAVEVVGIVPDGGELVRWLAPYGDRDYFRFAVSGPVSGRFVVSAVDSTRECAGRVSITGPGALVQSGLQPGVCAALDVAVEGTFPITVGVLFGQDFGPDVEPLHYRLSFEPAGSDPIVVTSLEDGEPAVDGVCSLREAVATANAEQRSDDCGGGPGRKIVELPLGEVSLASRLTLYPGVEIRGVASTLSSILATGDGHFDVIDGGNGILRTTLRNVTLRGASFGAVTGTGSVDVDRVEITGNSGGGIAVVGHVTAIDSAFTANSRFEGGAIYAGSVAITRGVYRLNTATNGGAVAVTTGPTVISGATFENNTAGIAGGALSLRGDVQIEWTTLSNNQAGASDETRGGAIAIAGFSGSASITDSTVHTNRASDGDGGAISTALPLTVQRTVLVDNLAGGAGGAIAASALLNVTQAVLVNNQASEGGAIALGAGADGSTVTRSILQKNTATRAGGGLHASVDATLSSTSVVDNRADDGSAGAGGGVAFVNGARMTASYVTIAQNAARSAGGGAFLTTPASGQHRIKDSILAPNVAYQSQAGHDCATAGTPSTLEVHGTVVVAASDGCATVAFDADSSVLAVDPGVRFIEATTDFINVNFVNGAEQALFKAAPRLSSVILPADTARSGNCVDLANFSLIYDLAGVPRPPSGCAIGATEASAEPETAILVDEPGDGITGCTLRRALASARGEGTGWCTPGGGGVDRIVFSAAVFDSAETAVITLGAPALSLDSRDVVIDGITGRESLPPVSIVGPGLQSVLEVRDPEGAQPPLTDFATGRLRGLRLQGSANSSDGNVLRVLRGSVVLEQTTMVGSSYSFSEQPDVAVTVAGGVRASLTVERSTLDATALGANDLGIRVDAGGRLFARRSSGASFDASLIEVGLAAVAFADQSTLAILEAVTAPVLTNRGLLVLRNNVIEFGENSCPIANSATARSLGGNLTSASCVFLNAEADNSGSLSGVIGSLDANGGRTPTLYVNGSVEISSVVLAGSVDCVAGELDQRGVPVAARCTPGAVEFNPDPTCDDGFVDPWRVTAEGTEFAELCDPGNDFGPSCNATCDALLP